MAAQIAETDAGGRLPAPADRRQFAGGPAGELQRLAAPCVGFAGFEHGGHQLLFQRLAQSLQQCCPADEIGGLVELHCVGQAGFERRFIGPEFRAPGAPAGLDAQRVERVVPGVIQAGVVEPEAVACFVQREVDVAGHLDRHVKLEAGPADVAHAGRAHAGVAEIDLAGVREPQALRADVVGTDAPEQRARVRAHHREHGIHRTDVGQRRVLGAPDMAFDPVGIPGGLCRAGDDQEALAREADHRQVALETTALVEHRGVDHPVDRNVDLVRAQALQHPGRVAALQQQLRERGLVV